MDDPFAADGFDGFDMFGRLSKAGVQRQKPSFGLLMLFLLHDVSDRLADDFTGGDRGGFPW